VRAVCGLGRCAPGALAKDCTAAPSEAEWNRAQSASAAKSCRGAFSCLCGGCYWKYPIELVIGANMIA
ncbi:hypothetical protein P9747_09750, partial [Paenibacillus macerans]|uniref:hypothetical protein n=1 Tax=Paenibacillus macerans TaxID=44252 RepID=UPI002E22CAF3|nr:hypothetical protein [Paenibacillus macerans]